MRFLSPRSKAALPLLLAPLLLTACSGSSPAGGGGAGGGDAVASAHARASAIASAEGSSQAPAASGPVKTGDQLCALVTPGDAASSMSTTPAIVNQESSSGPDDEPTCSFDSADRKVAVLVLWGSAKDDPYHPPMPTMGSGKTTAVEGLGHPAAANASEVDVKIGDQTLVVESFGDTDATRDQVIALAKLYVAKL